MNIFKALFGGESVKSTKRRASVDLPHPSKCLKPGDQSGTDHPSTNTSLVIGGAENGTIDPRLLQPMTGTVVGSQASFQYQFSLSSEEFGYPNTPQTQVIVDSERQSLRDSFQSFLTPAGDRQRRKVQLTSGAGALCGLHAIVGSLKETFEQQGYTDCYCPSVTELLDLIGGPWYMRQISNMDSNIRAALTSEEWNSRSWLSEYQLCVLVSMVGQINNRHLELVICKADCPGAGQHKLLALNLYAQDQGPAEEDITRVWIHHNGASYAGNSAHWSHFASKEQNKHSNYVIKEDFVLPQQAVPPKPDPPQLPTTVATGQITGRKQKYDWPLDRDLLWEMGITPGYPQGQQGLKPGEFAKKHLNDPKKYNNVSKRVNKALDELFGNEVTKLYRDADRKRKKNSETPARILEKILSKANVPWAENHQIYWPKIAIGTPYLSVPNQHGKGKDPTAGEAIKKFHEIKKKYDEEKKNTEQHHEEGSESEDNGDQPGPS